MGFIETMLVAGRAGARSDVDWKTIATTLVTTSVAVSAIGYLFRKTFERVVDARMKISEEQHKALITERARRKAAIFDKRLEAFQAALSLLYRARNAAREINEAPADILKGEIKTHVHRLDRYHLALDEVLFEDRLILSEVVFRELHRAVNLLHHFLETVKDYADSARMPNSEEKSQLLGEKVGELRRLYEEIDNAYQQSVIMFRKGIGDETLADEEHPH
jgi:hypothetical protein